MSGEVDREPLPSFRVGGGGEDLGLRSTFLDRRDVDPHLHLPRRPVLVRHQRHHRQAVRPLQTHRARPALLLQVAASLLHRRQHPRLPDLLADLPCHPQVGRHLSIRPAELEALERYRQVGERADRVLVEQSLREREGLRRGTVSMALIDRREQRPVLAVEGLRRDLPVEILSLGQGLERLFLFADLRSAGARASPPPRLVQPGRGCSTA